MLQVTDRRLGTELYWAFTIGRRLAPAIASGPAARAQVIWAGLLFGTGRRRRPVRLRLDAPGGRIRFAVPDYAAFKVLHEMFVLREYDVELDPAPRRIVDLGANVGASVLFFRRRWPEAEIVAVEASPRLADVLEGNVRGLRVEVHRAAVSAGDGTVTFYEHEQSWAGSVAGGDGVAVTVPALPLDALLDRPADLVKVDIEGGEFDVLPAATRLDRVRAVVGEVHAPPDAAETQRLFEALDGFDIHAEAAKHVFTMFTAHRRPAGAP